VVTDNGAVLPEHTPTRGGPGRQATAYGRLVGLTINSIAPECIAAQPLSCQKGATPRLTRSKQALAE